MEDRIISFLPTLDEVLSLAPHLRCEDVMEAKALGCIDIEQMFIQTYVYADEIYALKMNDQLIGVFGVQKLPTNSKVGMVFCFGNDNLFKKSVTITKIAIKYFKKWFEKYEMLSNVASIENEKPIKWLKFLGATFYEKMKINGNDFLPFVITKENLLKKQ